MKFLLPIVLLTLVEARAQLFHSDPGHPWNQLHRALNTRTNAAGRAFRHDGLEPASVPHSKHLIEGESHARVIRLLDDFLAHDRIASPLKRALMQRDLFAVFVDTANAKHPHHRPRRELQKRLVQAMRHIALTSEEIGELPNNFRSAAEAKTPGLPADLLQRNGAWVLVRNRQRADDLAANLHIRATHGRAAFFILIRFPEGRQAVLDYLKQLETHPRHTPIPQIPVGSQVALVRQTMLIDNTGELRASHLTESVQLRRYDDLKQPKMFEFRLHRDALFAGRAGGLLPTSADEQSYFALTHLAFGRDTRPDPIEVPEVHDPRFDPPVIMNSCFVCHAGPGIFGFQSMFAGHHAKLPLAPSTLETQIEPLIKRTQASYLWGLLQGLWETN